MGKPKAPKPPDPIKTGEAQTGTNIATAIANAGLNQVNQVTPDGSLSYSQSGNTSWTDPVSGKTYQIPRFTATQTLSPEQQSIKTQTDAAKLNYATLAKEKTGQLGQLMAQPFSYSTGEHEKWALGLYDRLNRDRLAQDEEAMRSRLVNQGFTEGTEGWDRAMRGFTAGRGDARNKFLLDSQGQGFQQAMATRNQPLNEIAALLGGSQIQQPNFVNTPNQSIATTDYAGLQQQDYQNRMANYNQQMQQRGALLGGLFGTGATLATGMPMFGARSLY